MANSIAMTITQALPRKCHNRASRLPWLMEQLRIRQACLLSAVIVVPSSEAKKVSIITISFMDKPEDVKTSSLLPESRLVAPLPKRGRDRIFD